MLDFVEYVRNILLNANSSKVVLCENGRSLTGKELFQQAAELASFFQSQNIEIGARIAIQLPNCIEYVICYFAGILGGYTIVPINSSLPQKDIDYIIETTQPAFFIKSIADLKFNKILDSNKILSTKETTIAIFFTSGTTNKPKGVCHSTHNMLANAVAFNNLIGFDNTTRMLHVMPMGYMAGFLNTVLCPILAGGCVVIAPQFNAKDAMYFWKVAVQQEINAMWISPTMAALIARLNRDKEISIWTKQNLRHVLVGTAPLPQATKYNFEETFQTECLESYGMSELLLVSGNTQKYIRIKASVGRILDNIEVQARDIDGEVLSKGQEGNLYVKTPFALQGYLDPNTKEVCSPLQNGWLETGDFGYIDEENNLFITGRVKDLIIHGGTNVSPRAVEEVLLHHPDVQDVVVIGKPHSFWGEEVIAFITLEKDKEFNLNELKNYCQSHLHADAVPSLFKIVNEFPRTSTGKVQAHKLRELV